MKKIALLAFMAMMFVGSANAQSFLSGLFNKISGSGSADGVQSTVTNVLGSLLGESMTLSKSTIKGTWTYNGTSCVLESDDALSKIGGSVVTGKVEEKMNGYLKKVGVKEGTCSFTFSENDSCVFRVGSREINGTYVLDGETRPYSSVSSMAVSHQQLTLHTTSIHSTLSSMPTRCLTLFRR